MIFVAVACELYEASVWASFTNPTKWLIYPQFLYKKLQFLFLKVWH